MLIPARIIPAVLKVMFLALLFIFLNKTATANPFALDPVTKEPWKEVVLSVTDPNSTARFFKEIGGYVEKHRGDMNISEIESWGLDPGISADFVVLGVPGQSQADIRLVRFQHLSHHSPMRPGSRAWDTGCYFSIMVRMKNIQKIYDDAIAMGWWTETPITQLQFGTSDLKVVIFKGPDGIQVQGYERMSPPLPKVIPEFERFTRPFNIMQTVRDRDAAYDFFTNVLGFQTFFKGTQVLPEVPTPSPLGIPINLTTSIPYQVGIMYPKPGEFGRVEVIEVVGLKGTDYSNRCDPPNLGILAVRFKVASAERAAKLIETRGWDLTHPVKKSFIAGLGNVKILSVKTPDGAIIQFYDSI